MMLQWKNSVAANMPEYWTAKIVYSNLMFSWSWVIRCSKSSNNLYTCAGLPTEDVAKISCEEFLIRNHILSIGDWTCEGRKHLLRCNNFIAVIRHYKHLTTWEIFHSNCSLLQNGKSTKAECKNYVEVLLCAMIAENLRQS